MIIKGIIVASSKSICKTADCEVILPSLKVNSVKGLELMNSMHDAEYVNVIFTLNHKSFEAAVYKKDNQNMFVNAKDLLVADIQNYDILLANNFLKRLLEAKNNPKEKMKKSFKSA